MSESLRDIGARLLIAHPDSQSVSAFVYGAEYIQAQREGIHEDELPEGYPYDEMFPFSWVDITRMFPPMEFVRGYLAATAKQVELTKGLRNCLGYARHELRRIERFKANGAEEWRAIVQFCEAAGVKSSILRGAEVTS